MGFKEKAAELAEGLKKSAEFIELKKTKMQIDSNKSLKAELESFNKKQMSAYMDKKSTNDTRSMADLKKRYEDLTKIPEVEQYLRASVRFNDLLAEVFKTINDSISRGLN